MHRPVNKLAALVVGSGWKHPTTRVPKRVMDRALLHRTVTLVPETLLADDRFIDYTNTRLANCVVLGLRADFGPAVKFSRTKLGWLWVIWCPECNSVVSRRCAYLPKLAARTNGCSAGCLAHAKQKNRKSRGLPPMKWKKTIPKSLPLNERPIIKC